MKVLRGLHDDEVGLKTFFNYIIHCFQLFHTTIKGIVRFLFNSTKFWIFSLVGLFAILHYYLCYRQNVFFINLLWTSIGFNNIEVLWCLNNDNLGFKLYHFLPC